MVYQHVVHKKFDRIPYMLLTTISLWLFVTWFLVNVDGTMAQPSPTVAANFADNFAANIADNFTGKKINVGGQLKPES